MEQARPPLFQATRLLRLARPHVSTRRNSHHVSNQRPRTRACYGLHYEKVPWIRLLCYDAADAHRYGATFEVC